eukprot:scaffold209046_cov12-Tisochrysis_lutea.AAC.1
MMSGFIVALFHTSLFKQLYFPDCLVNGRKFPAVLSCSRKVSTTGSQRRLFHGHKVINLQSGACAGAGGNKMFACVVKC